MPSAGIDRTTAALPPLDAPARRRAERQGWHLEFLDPADPDERSMLIRLAHPELDDATEQGRETVLVGGEPIQPRLHLAIHEVVATQIIDDDPPEAFQTIRRLLALGRDHHEALHMLGFCVSNQIWAALHDRRAYDREEHVSALAALPESFDRAFGPPAGHRAARGEAARRARRRR
jgi:hypothetical protein